MQALLVACAAFAVTDRNPGLALLGLHEAGGDVKAVSLSADERYAHVTKSDGHRIFDVSGAVPSLVGRYNVSGAEGHLLNGTTLYIVTVGDGVHAVNVGAPSDPVQLATIAGEAVDLAAHGGHLFVLNLTALSAYDVSDPASPSRVWGEEVFGDGHAVSLTSVAVVSGHVYVGCFTETLAIYDLSLARPMRLADRTLVGPTDTVTGIAKMTQVGARVYAAYSSGGIVVLDVADPVSPTVLGTWREDAPSDADDLISDPHLPSIVVRGSVVYATVSNSDSRGLAVVDASDPAVLQQVGKDGNVFGELALAGDRLFVAGNALAVYSLSGNEPRPTTPTPCAGTSCPLGCFQYEDVRVLSDKVYAGASNTGESCTARCKARGFRYAGTEFGWECWCGNSLEGASKTVSAACNVPCTGDRQEKCGSAFHLNVYSLEELQAKQAAPAPALAPVGCFSTGDKALKRAYRSATANSVKECLSVCGWNGFEYAALEFGDECWCGNSLPARREAATECNTPCSGDAGELCGGNDRALVFVVDGLRQSAPVKTIGAQTAASLG